MTITEGAHCAECGECDCDTQRCVMCRNFFCYDCIEWCGEEHDPDCGDWFCETCIEKAENDA